MSADAQSEIIKAIAATQDQNLKTVLLLLLGVLEELGSKIDAMRADEVGLKEAVLNGHSDKHNKHHDWIEERMGSNCADVCTWAGGKRKEEAERDRTAIEDAKADKRSARDAIIRTVVASLTSALITGLGVLAYLK